LINEPFSFTIGVGQVIKGGMKGRDDESRRQAQVDYPFHPAWRTGAGGTIPPNATLLFDVELLEVAK
jgi:peptidylprolyl isomerase